MNVTADVTTKWPSFPGWGPGLAALLLVVAGPAAADKIYKYVDRSGTVTYSAQKPLAGPYQRLEPSCLFSYLGCALSHADWNRVPLNHSAYREQIEYAARMHDVDPALVRAVVHAESNFNYNAVSRAGAQGLMQLMPDTQRLFGVSDPFNVRQNLDAGTRLFKSLLKRYRNNIKLAAAAYNAGTSAVERYKGIPPYEETKNYVRRVSQLYVRYQGDR